MPELVEKSNDRDEARIRLLICNTCNSIQPLPFYQGRPEGDTTLHARLEEHRFPDGNEHFGNLATVSERSWNDPTKRQGILDEMKKATKPGTGDGLGDEFYDVKNTFAEDAMKCWRIEHNRTSNCQDYKHDKKRLIPNTQKERKAEGLAHRAQDIASNTFLCDFCPYKSVVQTRVMKERDY